MRWFKLLAEVPSGPSSFAEKKYKVFSRQSAIGKCCLRIFTWGRSKTFVAQMAVTLRDLDAKGIVINWSKKILLWEGEYLWHFSAWLESWESGEWCLRFYVNSAEYPRQCMNGANQVSIPCTFLSSIYFRRRIARARSRHREYFMLQQQRKPCVACIGLNMHTTNKNSLSIVAPVTIRVFLLKWLQGASARNNRHTDAETLNLFQRRL